MESKNPKDLRSTSHPAVSFKGVPVQYGPLGNFPKKRKPLLEHVVRASREELETGPFSLQISEALYQEKLRLRKARQMKVSQLFTMRRTRRDVALWRKIESGLKKNVAEVDRKALLDKILHHYAEEIGGNFKPSVYRLAIHAVPWVFSWLLNAASVRRFLPWGMTQSLEQRLTILGEVPALQKLSQKGTILLVPTHQSNIDSVLIGYVIYLMQLPPFSYGAGLNLFSNPVLSFFMSSLGAYTVDRQKSNALYKTALKHYSTELLSHGIHSIFFPGGGRSRSGAIESKLKLGLLGTALDAQLLNFKENRPKPNIYVVPMVTSYHFVLEAGSLIEDYLEFVGKHLFLGADTQDTLPLLKTAKFFWRIFSSNSGVTMRVGRPLDVFGNFVDEDGNSIGPNGTIIDRARWLTTEGVLKANPDRDREYTRQLGKQIVDSYYRENTVLTSHAVAFALFLVLRQKYPDLDLYRFLRLSLQQRSVPLSEFLREAEKLHARLVEMANRGELYLSAELQTSDVRAWVDDGVRHLGLLHDHEVVKIRVEVVWTEDMNLLYYYRNRLSGYGLSLRGQIGRVKRLRGECDEQGFLA